MFNPEESIDFNGNTGPFIQYTYARIQSVLRKAEEKQVEINPQIKVAKLSEKEKELLKRLSLYPSVVKEAGDNYSPAVIANYCYELVKEFNQFYHDHSILGVDDLDVMNFRLVIASAVGKVVKSGMALLGVEMPERM